jgi:hypothetical protein
VSRKTIRSKSIRNQSRYIFGAQFQLSLCNTNSGSSLCSSLSSSAANSPSSRSLAPPFTLTRIVFHSDRFKLASHTQLIEMDDLNMSETAYLNVPDRDKSPSPADSVNSSVSDLSTLPISGRRRDYGVSTPSFFTPSSSSLVFPRLPSLPSHSSGSFFVNVNIRGPVAQTGNQQFTALSSLTNSRDSHFFLNLLNHFPLLVLNQS